MTNLHALSTLYLRQTQMYCQMPTHINALLKNGHSVDGLTYDYYTFLPQYSALPYSTIPQLCIDWSSMKQRKHIQKN